MFGEICLEFEIGLVKYILALAGLSRETLSQKRKKRKEKTELYVAVYLGHIMRFLKEKER